MRKNKILAGLLGIAMAASMLSVTVAADTSESGNSFTNAWGDVIKAEDCLYYEDFENYTGNNFDISADIQGKGYWHSSVTEKDGNKAMRYYATPNAKTTDEEGNETAVEYDSADGKALLNNEILPKTTDINNNGWYEIGYTYYADDMRAYMTDIFGVYMEKSIVSRLASHNWSYPQWLRHWTGANYPDGFFERNGWGVKDPIAIKVILDASTGDIVQYYKYGSTAGNVKSYGKHPSNPGYSTKIKVGDSANINLKMVCAEDPVKTANRTIKSGNTPYGSVDEPGFRIDNFYVKKLTHDTPTVTFDNNGEKTEVKVNYFNEVKIPEKPVREGYIFIGWYDAAGKRVDGTDEKPVTILSGITEDATITAKWTKLSTVTFDSKGGTEIEPITTETGEITLPERPVKPGYSFAGWYTDEAYTMPFDEKNISDSMTVYAKWSEYLIKEDFENYTSGLFDIDSEITAKGYWHSEVVDDGTGNKYMKYYMTPSDELKFDAADGAKLINREILASTEAINKDGWYEIGYTYYPNGMKANMSNIFGIYMCDMNTVVSAIGVHRDILPGWLGDTAKYYNDIITQNLWTIEGPISIKTIYTAAGDKERTYLTFTENGKEKSIVTSDGPMKTPRKKVGSSSNIGLKIKCETDPTLLTKGNVEQGFMIDDFYVKELNTLTPTVTFVDGDDIQTASANYFKEVTLPTPTKEGFEFAGWYTDSDEQFTGKNVTEDITVYARWSGTYDVIFNANGGSYADGTSVKSITAESNEDVTAPEVPTKEGYTFSGWFTDEKCTNAFEGKVYANTTLYARWQGVPRVEKITPADKAENVDLKPQINIVFDSEMDSSTLTRENIKVMRDGEALQSTLYNINSVVNTDRKTVVTINFTTSLEVSSKYIVTVGTGAKNLHSGLAEAFTSEFTTKGLMISVTNVNVEDENGAAVESLAAVKGKKIKVTLTISNNAGKTTEYTSVYSFRDANKIKSAKIASGSMSETPVTTELTVPENVKDGDKLEMILVEDISNLAPLAGKTKIIGE